MTFEPGDRVVYTSLDNGTKYTATVLGPAETGRHKTPGYRIQVHGYTVEEQQFRRALGWYAGRASYVFRRVLAERLSLY
jgi:hypothetical protein